MKIFIKFFILIILLTSTAFADQKITGHMKPLPNEILANPIELKECGLTIHEWSGTSPTKVSVERLRRICIRAVNEFHSFIKMRGLEKKHNTPFSYDVALVKDSRSYRGMNDVKYRFVNRYVKGYLWAYTSNTQGYIFMVSTVHIKEMPNIFSHEIWHAMSKHYGIFDAHADNDADRVRIDEVLAQDFTKYLGLGR